MASSVVDLTKSDDDVVELSSRSLPEGLKRTKKKKKHHFPQDILNPEGTSSAYRILKGRSSTVIEVSSGDDEALQGGTASRRVNHLAWMRKQLQLDRLLHVNPLTAVGRANQAGVLRRIPPLAWQTTLLLTLLPSGLGQLKISLKIPSSRISSPVLSRQRSQSASEGEPALNLAREHRPQRTRVRKEQQPRNLQKSRIAFWMNVKLSKQT